MDLSEYVLEPVHADETLALYRGKRRANAPSSDASILVLRPISEHPAPATLERLGHEYSLADQLEASWAARPLAFTEHQGRPTLVLEDCGGAPMDALLGKPMQLGLFLRLAVGLATALRELHARGIIHKDVKPSNALVETVTGRVWLTGFGIASRLRRERQAAQPPEFIAGTLPYMAPEQTGLMNRSIDSRSDLYALGVTLYQMLTGALPFLAAEPMEWVHSHIARKPVPPCERLSDVPARVSAIIMKLLAKTAEDRYQTAAGLEADLESCQTEWEAHRRIDDRPLGERDTPDQLVIPEKLYGREREIETLFAAFDRIVKGGVPELVLVSGYSGIGKSSVVNELQPVLVPPRGLFASGKFDQYKRDIPYSTLAQAFQSLIRQLLTKSETELGKWRGELQDALDPHGQLIVELAPELKLIIGDQPPVPEVPAQDAQRRFQLAFRRFIGVFAQPEHPLAVFLDDLQWLDAATLDLLEDLLTRSELRHLVLIGAYRDNEVDAAHPLMRKLEAIKGAGGSVKEITLGPLSRPHLGHLLADALRCEPEHGAPLARLVHEKTGGNPFFAIQFISSLAEEDLLAFDHAAKCWSWDLDRIVAQGFTDNVIDLMITKLNRLPARTQAALQQLACLGNTAEIATLSTVLETSPAQVHEALWESVHQGLIERLNGSYKFIHDRVHEAAYVLIPEAARAEVHLRLGRLLLASGSPETREEKIFDIVNHLNRGAAVMISRAEREHLAELDLSAGRRAKASIAYASALKYFETGASLLDDDAWERRRDLLFLLELERGECEFLTGEVAAADERLKALSNRTENTVERAALAYVQMTTCSERGQFDRAVAVALDYLRHVGIDLALHPTDDDVKREYEQMWSRLGGRPIEEIANLPPMSDPEALATVGILMKALVPALVTDPKLEFLTNCRAVNLSLQHGNCDASTLAYVALGRVVVARFGDYRTAMRFGQVGFELVEGGLKRMQAGTYLVFGLWVVPWGRHVRIAIDLFRRAFDAAIRVGDLTFAANTTNCLNTALLVAGAPLGEIQREAETGLAFVQKARLSGGHTHIIIPQLALVRTLRGLTAKFGCFDCELIDERRFEAELADNPFLRLHEFWYWLRKLQARYLAGDYAAGMQAASKAQPLLWASSSYVEEAEYQYYAALCRAAACNSLIADERQEQLESLAQHQRLLANWAENCPENFENLAALVGAEVARIEGRELDAQKLYEKAIRSARSNGFMHQEALASELAARFYAAGGFDTIARAYLRNARYGYLRWGADGKVRQLDQLYPDVPSESAASASTSTIGAPVEDLDLATVVKVSQAISTETDPEKAIATIMRLGLEHAGAERGLLILPQGDEYRVEAEARTGPAGVLVELRRQPVAQTDLPRSVLDFVLRTRESVLLDDASATGPFSQDEYLRSRHARSVLCMPLLKQGRLVGLIYLENNLIVGAFTPTRMSLLQLLASDAAIALENTRLYHDLREGEARVRRLVESNIIGIFIWNLDGRILDTNEAFLRIIGYDREELVSGRVRWTDLLLPGWDARVTRAVGELRQMEIQAPEEWEYVRKDGSRVQVLLGSAAFDGTGGSEGVAFVSDLTDFKRAEHALRDSDLRYHEVQLRLADANRIASIAELSASIAHEINQPLSGIITNATAGLRMLAADPPNIEAASETVRRTLRDGKRAGEVISRLRALFARKHSAHEPVNLNEAAQEVLGMFSKDAQREQVALRTNLCEASCIVMGDRVQLQQVILNLLRNGLDAVKDSTEDPRELRIETAVEEGERVLLTVRDSGVGLGSVDPERIFEAFHSTKEFGMGIGLSVSRSIVDSHHGRLWAAQNPGPGATFFLSLPCASARSTTS